MHNISEEIALRFGEVRIYIHKPIIEKSAMINAAFKLRMKERLSGEMIPGEGDVESWATLLLAMYNSDVVPQRAFTKSIGVLLVEAMFLADYCMANDAVKDQIAKMMTVNFAKMSQWKDIPVNAMTYATHELSVEEINDTFCAYRASTVQQKPFSLAAFSVMVSLVCPIQVYLEFQGLFDDELIRGVALSSMKLQNQVPMKLEECALFILTKV
jgi:hypothetical protein